MHNLEADATNRMINLGVEMMSAGFKLGGGLAKEVLLATLEKIKENDANKIGLTSLKGLLKSKEELNVVNLSKEHLDFFKRESKKLGIGFSSVTSKDNDMAKIIYKTKDVNLVKNLMAEILEKTKNEKGIVTLSEDKLFGMLDKIDFKGNDDNIYRYFVESIERDKAVAIKDLLLINNIKSDVVVNSIGKNDTLNVDYKVDLADKDKTIEIIDSCKGRSIEDIVREINEKSKVKNKDKVEEVKEEKKIPLKQQIEKVDKQLKSNNEKANAEKRKSKNKSKDKDR